MITVIKRDGRMVPFDKRKIENAVTNAFLSVDVLETEYSQTKSKNIADYIEKYCLDNNISEIDIEKIQDLVENGLMATKRKDVAKQYVLYRDERNRVREAKSELMKTLKKKLSASDVQNQNANVDEYSFGGRRGEADSELNKQLALDEYVSKMARENHINNEIYIHDLDSYVVGCHNCLSIPFDKLLAEGFNTRQTDIRPAGSINTAMQLVAVVFQLQSLQQFGL